VKISQIGEDKLIQGVKEKMNFNLGEGVVGIGDDCAVVPLGENKLMLFSTDSLVEGCHFIKEKISPRDLGYKAVMVNVSDVAAMGGRGRYALMSIAMPKGTDASWFSEYMNGVKEACEEVGVGLIGGDTTSSKGGIFINFSIVGEVLRGNVKYRKDAREGDVICVTDTLGDSLAGYEMMMSGKNKGSLVEKHCCPKARFREGEWLGGHSSVRGMMDISDGLFQDLGRMMKASGYGAEVDIDKIPVSREFIEFAREHDWPVKERAVISGEEYGLLLTVNSVEYQSLSDEFEKIFSRPLYAIGIVKGGRGVRFIKNGKVVEIEFEGYLHFKD